MPSLSADLDQQLDELLAEGAEGAQQREASAFDELTGGNTTELVLFGAGNLGRRTLARLRKIGVSPLCFIDNNSARWGQAIDGIPVMSPAEGARLYGSSAAFVVTVWVLWELTAWHRAFLICANWVARMSCPSFPCIGSTPTCFCPTTRLISLTMSTHKRSAFDKDSIL